VNPYLKAKREEYESHRKAITDLQDLATRERRELTADELRSVADHGQAAEKLYGEIEDLSAGELRDAKVAAMSARLEEAAAAAPWGSDSGENLGDPAGPALDGMYSLVPSFEQMEQLRSAVKDSRGLRLTTNRLPRSVTDREHLRAAVTMSLTGGRVDGLSGRLPEPRRLARTVGLQPKPSTTAGISGPKFGATSGTAPTAEGAAKPEAATVTKLDISIKQLARWTTLSRMALLSQGDVMEQVVSWHALAIAKDEDKLIIDALNTAAGSAIAFVSGDQRGPVRQAMAKVEDAVSAQCDVCIVHPDNYGLLAGFDPTTADTAGGLVVQFGSGVLYPSSACPTGFAIVAAVRAAGAFIVAQGPSVASLDALSTNETTVRTEELVGFDVRLVGAVAKVDIVTP
jgi:hypothetical protein